MQISPQELVELARLISDGRGLAMGQKRIPKSESVIDELATPSINRPSRVETRTRIIELLKSTYLKEGFSMREAVQLVAEKLDRQEHTASMAMRSALNQGIIIRRGRGYFFTEFIKKQVETKLRDQIEEKPPEMIEAPIPSSN